MTRDGVRGEGIRGGYGAVYAELKALETLGVCRRGYFVEGLGGAVRSPGAVERLRELRAAPRGEQPEAPRARRGRSGAALRAGLPWPRRSGARAARVAGAWVVLLDGEAALFVERGGRSLVPLREPDPEWLRPALAALVAHVRAGGAKRLAVERFDGVAVTESDAMQLLVEAGFLAGPRRAVPVRNGGEPSRAAYPEMPVRAPHLYPLLRGFVLGSFVVLGRELEEGAELPFAFEEHVERRGPSLYELRRSRAFIEEREPSAARGKMRGWR